MSMYDGPGTIAPCHYPGCTDRDGNPRLTHIGICEPCRHRYRHVLRWLALDYAYLKVNLPTASGAAGAYEAPKQKSFGHPAEWASDTCAEIATVLNWAEDGLRDWQQHSPGLRPDGRETARVATAYRYLLAQFDGLCVYPAAADTAVELSDLHRTIRGHLGQNRWVQHLPTPCPWCDVAALVRTVGQIDCESCGKTIDERHYDWLAGMLIDQLIEDYDTQSPPAA